ncbi:TetR/AcrR family transcriptional regulator [Paraliomyxa miuraensis]|uniref:TetR/AcrR family transcriptional regulator n=1 Tax=Paraliomyxa miuraensis TaxID=376150 RepID=UPI00224E6C95|nr:TetR/AcrR family transcriptional regulator [Paraliomyxa miuraensis]MCX4244968.1 TetR/AcrR family transcriptional regulator [Paraliomyxa miuraensis]
MSSSSSAPATGPATARGQRTRNKLLAAAETVFGDMGYERASIVEITRAAGVAQGTFYVYFPSKKAVFVELVWELNRKLRRSLRAATDALVDPDRFELERVGALTFLRFVQEHKDLYRIVRQAEFVDEELFREYYRELSAGYRRGLEQSMDKGEIRRFDPEALVYMLMGILDFVGMRWVLWENELPSEAVIEDMVRFIRDGLRRREGEDG